MTFDPNAPGNSVSGILLFFALVVGTLLYPCEWCARKTGLVEENWQEQANRKKHYPGCPYTDDYMCTYRGYEWDGTYEK